MVWPACGNCCTEALGAVTGGGTEPTAASAPCRMVRVFAPDRLEQGSAHTAGHCRSVGGHCGRAPEKSNHVVLKRPLLASCCEDTVWCSAILWRGSRWRRAGAPCWASIAAGRLRARSAAGALSPGLSASNLHCPEAERR